MGALRATPTLRSCDALTGLRFAVRFLPELPSFVPCIFSKSTILGNLSLSISRQYRITNNRRSHRRKGTTSRQTWNQATCTRLVLLRW